MLLKAGIDMEVPQRFIKWLQSFLRDRRYHVREGRSRTRKPVRFATGVPQGSVLGPLLYLISANSLFTDLAALEDSGLEHGAHADDLTIWSTGRFLADIVGTAQSGLNVITSWAKRNRMVISLKSSVILFTNDNELQPPTTLTVGGVLLSPLKEVKLLGMTLDSKLTFAAHVNARLKMGFLRLNQMSQITHATWGPSALDMRAVYLAYVRSCYLYCASVYFPFLSASHTQQLQSQQQRAACMITGAVATPPAVSVQLEANLLPLATVATIQLVAVVERAKRLPPVDPMFRLVTGRLLGVRRVMQHRSQGGWQGRADDALRDVICVTPNRVGTARSQPLKLVLRRAPLLIVPLTKPWDVGRATLVEFCLTLTEPCPKSLPDSERRRIATATLAALGPFSFELWTDGSVQVDRQSGKEAGAGAAHLYDSASHSRHPVHKDSKAAGYLSSSFTAEGVGLLVGAQHLQTVDLSGRNEPTLLICSDSLSQLHRLSQGPLAQDTCMNSDIWRHLLSLVRVGCFRKIVLQYVPAHCGLARNEAIDKFVGGQFDRLLASQHQALTPLGTIKASLKLQARLLYQEEAKRATTSSTTGTTAYRSSAFLKKNPVPWTKLKISRSLLRLDETLLTQLRCGWCVSMGPLWHNMNPSAVNPHKHCRWCASVPETIPHLFSDCKAVSLVEIKRQLQLKNSKSLGSEEVTELMKCVKFARLALSALQQ